eukprot:m.3790 g.3790  ORF g.3790 m.3790 type:complete len:407 (+) comp9814_c0_seq1:84-1304(+)
MTDTPWIPIERCFRKKAVVNAAKYLAVVSSCLSIVGTLLIIGTFLVWRDIRSHTRRILVYISIADFVTAAGYLVGIAGTFNTMKTRDHFLYRKKHVGCEVQSWFTTTSSMVSFLWTDVLAISLLLSVVYQRPDKSAKLMPLFHLINWVIPIVLTSAALCEGYLGPDFSSDSVGWCWIVGNCNSSMNATITSRYCKNEALILVWEIVAGKGWEVMSYFLVLTLCLIIRFYLSKERKMPRSIIQRDTAIVAREFERKMLLVPLLFVFIRIWGTVRYFLNVGYFGKYNDCPPSSPLDTLNKALLILQGIGDPAQGWVNCILYCFMTRKIRGRLFAMIPSCRRKQTIVNRSRSDSLPSQPSPSCRRGSIEGSGSKSESLRTFASDESQPLLLPDAGGSYYTGPVCGKTPP